jgi:transglutaminase-like putative cysteine protease
MTADESRIPETPNWAKPWRISARALVDVGVLTLLSVVGIVGFASSLQQFGWLIAGLGGLLVGTVVAVLAHRLRLGTVTTLVLAIVAFFLLGTAFSQQQRGLLGFIPTLDSLAGLAVGSVFGWRDILTLRPPVSLPDYVTAVPFVAAWAVSLVSTTLAIRWLPERRRTPARAALLLVGPLALYLVGVLLGTDEPFFAAVRGVAFAAVALVWIGWRRGVAPKVSAAGSRTLFRRKLLGTVALVLAAVVIGSVAGTVAAPRPENRFVLREEIEPPFEPLNYASPFSAYRKYTKTLEQTTLFTIDGLAPGQAIRLATLDTYDGVIWGVAGSEISSDGSGSFGLVGRNIPRPTFITAEGESQVTVTVRDYSDVWVPDVGAPTALEFAGENAQADAAALRYNDATGTAVLTTGLSAGDSYTVEALTQRQFDTESLADVPIATLEVPPVTNIPDVVAAKAKEYAGDATSPIAQLRNIENELSTTGYLSHGAAGDVVASRAGQGADRMIELFSRNQLVGDQEQYATAFALMSRSLGYSARVVMGFAPEVPETGGPVTVTGADVTAWVEVPFDGIGWVSFFPTPDNTDIPQDQVPKPQSEPQPQVRQPPRMENQENDLVVGVDIDESDKDDAKLFIFPAWVWIAGISILIPLLIIFVPLLIVAAIKRGRRKRRRDLARGDIDAAGAWDEMLDQFSELGYELPDNATRPVTAQRLESQVDRPLALAELAAHTDTAVFSGQPVSREWSDTVWTEAMASVALARAAVSRGRRILSRYRIGAARAWARRLTKSAGENRPDN